MIANTAFESRYPTCSEYCVSDRPHGEEGFEDPPRNLDKTRHLNSLCLVVEAESFLFLVREVVAAAKILSESGSC